MVISFLTNFYFIISFSNNPFPVNFFIVRFFHINFHLFLPLVFILICGKIEI
nr:MAG TPA: hypothetical protein [Caudoviricetes sp.]